MDDNVLLPFLRIIRLPNEAAEGIQKILNCGIGYVSYLLKKNEDRELIFRRKVKVKNKKRRQLGFFLTTNGVDYSIKIKNSYIEYKTNSNIIIIDKPLAKMEIFD